MKINVVTKNGVSSISFQCKTDFNEVLDKNLAAICEAIADKGVIIKELLNLFEEFNDDFLETVWLTARESSSTKEAEQSLSEELGICPATVQYLLNTSFDKLTALNAKKVQKMLDDYNANISKLVV